MGRDDENLEEDQLMPAGSDDEETDGTTDFGDGDDFSDDDELGNSDDDEGDNGDFQDY